jgi:hypothetical protein
VRPVTAPASEQLTLWPPGRLGVALLAVIAAASTAVVGVLAGPDWAAIVGGIHITATVVAVVAPATLPAQVAAGVVLAWSLFAETGGSTTLETGRAVALVAIVVGVIATAELLGLAAQMGIVVPRRPAPGLARVALTVAAALGVAVVTLVVGRIEGPRGLVATLLAVVASLGFVALVLHRGGSALPDDS